MRKNFFEFRDVNKSFDDNYVLKNVTFRVKRGETCVIMGRSGVGKSVSLKHIMGFMKADSGRIFVDGQDVTDFTEQSKIAPHLDVVSGATRTAPPGAVGGIASSAESALLIRWKSALAMLCRL